LYDKGKVVQFHENYYPNGHIVPDLKKWFEVEESKNSTSIFMVSAFGLVQGGEKNFSRLQDMLFFQKST
jgi:hypothetical protein